MSSSTPEEPHRRARAVDEHASNAGLRTVAIFEATKGVLAIVLVTALLAMRHRMEDFVEELLYHLHIGFEHKWAQALLHGASNLSDMRVQTVLAIALAYAAVRFIESWGLWHRRVWAEWFALVSGALYLPIEIDKVVTHRHWPAVVVLLGNLAIIAYMLEIRLRAMRLRRAALLEQHR